MRNPFRKKSKRSEDLSREEIVRLANRAIEVSEPEDLRELAQSALEKMARG